MRNLGAQWIESWICPRDDIAVVTGKISFFCLALVCSDASQVILTALQYFLHKEGMFADTPNKPRKPTKNGQPSSVSGI